MNGLGLSQRLELRQSQNLVMTPQLRQAIRMLQLSNLDLASFLESEIEQNPLLEPGERGGEEAAEADGDMANGTLGEPPTLAEDVAEHWRTTAGEEGDAIPLPAPARSQAGGYPVQVQHRLAGLAPQDFYLQPANHPNPGPQGL